MSLSSTIAFIFHVYLCLLLKSFYRLISFNIAGGLECGHCYLWQILKQYTNTNNVIVQYGGDNGVFGLMGSHMSQFIMIMEKDVTFCNELPRILHAEADRLNRQKAIVEETHE